MLNGLTTTIPTTISTAIFAWAIVAFVFNYSEGMVLLGKAAVVLVFSVKVFMDFYTGATRFHVR